MFKKSLFYIATITLLYSCAGNKKDNSITEFSNSDYTYLLVGAYTAETNNGINVYKLNTETGESSHLSEATISNPSYLAISKNEKYIYAVSENGVDSSKVNSFSFDKRTGTLSFINSQVTEADPCYISVDDKNKHALTANYSGGSIAVMEIAEDGSLKPNTVMLSFTDKGLSERQGQSHLHCTKLSKDNKFLFATNLGGDLVYRYEYDAVTGPKEGAPKSFSVKAGSGPRHLEFHPNDKYAYLITELSGDVIAFTYNAREGLLNEIQTIKADTLNAAGSGDIHITPNGEYLYASNRLKGDGLAIFSIDQATGMLTKVGYQPTGSHPRNFVITNNGKLLLVANRDTNNIQVFSIDSETGLLIDTNQDIKLSQPVCLKFASME